MATGQDAQISDAVLEMKIVMEKILEAHVEMRRDIKEIKTNLFNPDEGLYARVYRNTEFRTAASKWLWVLTTGITVTMLHALFRYVVR